MISSEQVRRFSAFSARQTQALWAATIELEDGTFAEVGKGPTRTDREPASTGAGWVSTSRASFTAEIARTFRPAMNARFTITASPDADEVGTRWIVFSVRPQPQSGQHVFVCTRLK